MGNETDIRVVKVEDHGASRAIYRYLVRFNEPVWLDSEGWGWLAPQDFWWCEDKNTDMLGAAKWGLGVIEAHKEKVRADAFNQLRK